MVGLLLDDSYYYHTKDGNGNRMEGGDNRPVLILTTATRNGKRIVNPFTQREVFCEGNSFIIIEARRES